MTQVEASEFLSEHTSALIGKSMLGQSFAKLRRFECETICVRKMEEEEGRRRLIVVARACNLTVVCHFCKRVVCHLSRIHIYQHKNLQ